MLNILGSLKSLVKLHSIKTEGSIFRLNITVTVLILMTCCIIISTKQYTGDPTVCFHQYKDVVAFANTYCWITSTYTMEKPYRTINSSKKLQYVYNSKKQSSPIREHEFYQWVSHVLFLQAVFVYFPRLIWKEWEGGLLKSLFLPLLHSTATDQPTIRNIKVRQFSNYLLTTLRCHDWYAVGLFTSEFLLLVNFVAQFFALDLFLSGHFKTFGLDLARYWRSKDMENPIEKLFPNLAKCDVTKYGTSGDQEIFNVLCILPLNVWNGKIFIFLWFWLLTMIWLCSLVLCYRVVLCCCSRLRLAVLSLRFGGVMNVHLKKVFQHCSIGDWVLLNAAAKSLDHFFMQDVIFDMSNNIDKATLDKATLEEATQT